MQIETFSIKFNFYNKTYRHYYWLNELGSLNELEHLALINFIKVNKIDGFGFYTDVTNYIEIDKNGNYKTPFSGYGDIENLLMDKIKIDNNITNLTLNYMNAKSIKFIECTDSNFKINDLVYIINTGGIYPAYTEAFKELNMNPLSYDFIYKGQSDINKYNRMLTKIKFKITKILKHPLLENTILTVIQNENGKDILINILGLEKR